MEHVQAPRNGGAMDAAHAAGRASLGGRAPYVTIYLKARDAIVTKAMSQTFGCGVSIACCSALTEMITGRSVADCETLTGESLIESLSGIPADKQFCAHMAVDALRDALSHLPPVR